MDWGTEDDTKILARLRAKAFSFLTPLSVEEEGGKRLGRLMWAERDLYEPLLTGVATMPHEWYDYNVGFMIPHLDIEQLATVVAANRSILSKSEGVAWGLGEAGSDDERIVDFLYHVCEACADYDAWWCAAEALEKLIGVDATDLKKRTLRGAEWAVLANCLEHLDQRPAIIGVLRLTTAENLHRVILPACQKALSVDERLTVRNCVWLLERLRVDDQNTLEALYRLYDQAEDISHSLRPRIVEAFGRIGAASVRPVLESALLSAKYYRTRAYAADGLGRIGESRSLRVLEQALHQEIDPRVVSHITSALYAIRNSATRLMNQAAKAARWPENGMIADESNKWYGTPDIYDKFSAAEDPLGLSLEFALSLLPPETREIADLGTGTGRFALFVAEQRPDIEVIHALDATPEMHEFLKHRLRFASGLKDRVRPVLGRNEALPFDDQSLDALVSSWGFPSGIWNKAVCLKEVCEARRVLRPNGRLITLGWDETFRDQLSELWYRFVPEPDFRRESIEEWRRRRRQRLASPRNCHLTWVRQQFKVPLLFASPIEAAEVIGHLFGFSAGEWVSQQQRCEFSILAGITCDDTADLDRAISALRAESGQT